MWFRLLLGKFDIPDTSLLGTISLDPVPLKQILDSTGQQVIRLDILNYTSVLICVLLSEILLSSDPIRTHMQSNCSVYSTLVGTAWFKTADSSPYNFQGLKIVYSPAEFVALNTPIAQ